MKHIVMIAISFVFFVLLIVALIVKLFA